MDRSTNHHDSPWWFPHRGNMTHTHFTDTENTGAPLVPMVEPADVAADGGQADAEYLEEVIWSHRLED